MHPTTTSTFPMRGIQDTDFTADDVPKDAEDALVFCSLPTPLTSRKAGKGTMSGFEGRMGAPGRSARTGPLDAPATPSARGHGDVWRPRFLPICTCFPRLVRFSVRSKHAVSQAATPECSGHGKVHPWHLLTATGRTQAKRVTRFARQIHAPEPQSVQGTGGARILPGVPAMKPGLARCATSAVVQGGIRLGGRSSVLGMGSA